MIAKTRLARSRRPMSGMPLATMKGLMTRQYKIANQVFVFQSADLVSQVVAFTLNVEAEM
jgi:hypothetical protein